MIILDFGYREGVAVSRDGSVLWKGQPELKSQKTCQACHHPMPHPIARRSQGRGVGVVHTLPKEPQRMRRLGVLREAECGSQ